MPGRGIIGGIVLVWLLIGVFAAWQRGYFAFLARNSRPLPDDLGIPAERRVELGVAVAI